MRDHGKEKIDDEDDDGNEDDNVEKEEDVHSYNVDDDP